MNFSVIDSPKHLGIIWDLDKTLVRFEMKEGTIDRWREELAEIFLPYGWNQTFRPILTTLEAALVYLETIKSSEEVQCLREEIYSNLNSQEEKNIEHIHLIESMLFRLSAWNQQGVRMTLVTNNGELGTQKALNAINTFLMSMGRPLPKWLGYFPRSSEYLSKPESSGMALAIRAIETEDTAPLSHVLVIGDSPFDWEAASRLRNQYSSYEIRALAATNGELSWPPEPPSFQEKSPQEFLAKFGLAL